MESLIYLTYIAVILLIGIICTLISRYLKIPNMLILLIVGIIINKLGYSSLISSNVLLTSIAVLALVMIVFDSFSRFKFKEFDTFSIRALKLTLFFLILNLIFLSISTYHIFKISSIALVILFSALMSSTSPTALLSIFKETKKRLVKMLEIESTINTPLMILIVFIILEIINSTITSISSLFTEQIIQLLQNFFLGIGVGLLIGIISLKIIRKKYSSVKSPLIVIISALLAYVLAENLNGNGVFAIIVIGLIFGSFYLKEKELLHEFSSVFSNSLEILVLILIAIIIELPLNKGFIINSLILFLIFILIRLFAIMLTFTHYAFTLKEKIFMSLNVQKGIAVAVVLFSLLMLEKNIFNSADIIILSQLTLAFLLYSVIISTIILPFSKYFIEAKQ